MDTRSESISHRGLTNGNTADFDHWRASTRVFLQPIAAPSILGLFGFATATLMVGAWMAGWYGNALTPLALFPFVLTAGGIVETHLV